MTLAGACAAVRGCYNARLSGVGFEEQLSDVLSEQ